MFTWRWPVVVLAVLTLAAELPAQIPILRAPGGMYYGAGFNYHRRHLNVSGGFWGGVYPLPVLGLGPYCGYPYGVAYQQTTVNFITPPPVVVVQPALPRLVPYAYDVTGVDLDLQPAKPPPQPQPAKAKKDPDLPGVDVSVPRKPVRPGEKPPPAPPAQPRLAPAPPDAPKDIPREEYDRLLALGLTAFRAGEYGVACRRFRQASQIEPARADAFLLAAQALLALGKYREAVGAIEAGMQRQPDWPKAPFQPRLDLYKGREEDFGQHLQWLAQTVANNPASSPLLFLYAYQLWFDNRRLEAVDFFRRARERAVTPLFIDAFLRAAAPGPLAAK